MDYFNPVSLRSKCVLVTGASSGLGRATAIILSKLGAEIIMVGRNEERLAEVSSCLACAGYYFTADVNRPEQVSACFQYVQEKTSGLDGIVHCAGLSHLAPIRTAAEASFSDILRSNLESSWNIARTFRKKAYSKGRSCSIVFLSSISANHGSAGMSAYCASKAGVEGLTRALAVELARDQIRVNAVAPGLVETPMSQDMRSRQGEAAYQSIVARHPLGLGTPDDVAFAVAFLLSDMARWITGSTLVVDGGYTAA